MIYYVKIHGETHWSEPGAIKIGYTGRLMGRLPQLENEYGCDVELLGVHGGERIVEQCIHGRFDEERITSRKELFRPSERLMAYIAKNTEAWTYRLDRDKQYDDTIRVVFFGDGVKTLDRMAKAAGLDFAGDISDRMAVINKALDFYARSIGVKTDFADELPPPPVVHVTPFEEFVSEGAWG